MILKFKMLSLIYLLNQLDTISDVKIKNALLKTWFCNLKFRLNTLECAFLFSKISNENYFPPFIGNIICYQNNNYLVKRIGFSNEMSELALYTRLLFNLLFSFLYPELMIVPYGMEFSSNEVKIYLHITNVSNFHDNNTLRLEMISKMISDILILREIILEPECNNTVLIGDKCYFNMFMFNQKDIIHIDNSLLKRDSTLISRMENGYINYINYINNVPELNILNPIIEQINSYDINLINNNINIVNNNTSDNKKTRKTKLKRRDFDNNFLNKLHNLYLLSINIQKISKTKIYFHIDDDMPDDIIEKLRTLIRMISGKYRTEKINEADVIVYPHSMLPVPFFENMAAKIVTLRCGGVEEILRPEFKSYIYDI